MKQDLKALTDAECLVLIALAGAVSATDGAIVDAETRRIASLAGLIGQDAVNLIAVARAAYPSKSDALGAARSVKDLGARALILAALNDVADADGVTSAQERDFLSELARIWPPESPAEQAPGTRVAPPSETPVQQLSGNKEDWERFLNIVSLHKEELIRSFSSTHNSDYLEAPEKAHPGMTLKEALDNVNKFLGVEEIERRSQEAQASFLSSTALPKEANVIATMIIEGFWHERSLEHLANELLLARVVRHQGLKYGVYDHHGLPIFVAGPFEETSSSNLLWSPQLEKVVQRRPAEIELREVAIKMYQRFRRAHASTTLMWRAYIETQAVQAVIKRFRLTPP